MIVAICGRQRSGKDHAAAVLSEAGVTRVAFADPMRKAMYDLNPAVSWKDIGPMHQFEVGLLYLQEIVDDIGWDRAKEEYPEVRRMLQRFGTEMGRNNFGEDFWLDLAWDRTAVVDEAPTGKDLVITDARFANELKRVKENGVLWRIERADLGAEDLTQPRYSHASERDWRREVPDVVLYNEGTSEPHRYTNVIQTAWSVSRGLDIDRKAEEQMPVKVIYEGNNLVIRAMTREEMDEMIGKPAAPAAAA